MKPMRYGRYEALKLIASGGMGSVYVARTVGPGGFERLVAIKVMHDHIAADPEFSAMFLDEARLAAKIRHPNVVPTLDVAADGQFIVLELVDGASLRDALHQRQQQGEGPVPLPIAVRIILDVLEGLHAAHELANRDGRLLKLVHRDISPHNILIGVDGVARITDFGIAFAEARLTSTRRGQLKGKMPYMAPEQLEGGAIDRRVDVYAAGCVLWEMLTGQRLFVADNEAALACLVLAGPNGSPRDLCPDLPRPINAACMQALARCDDRFTSAAAFAEAIDAAATQAAVSTARPRAVAKLIEGVRLQIPPAGEENDLPLSGSTSRDSDAPPPSAPTDRSDQSMPLSASATTIDDDLGPWSEQLPAAVRPVAVGGASAADRAEALGDDSTEETAALNGGSDRSPTSAPPELLGERTNMAASLATLPLRRRPTALNSAIVAAVMASVVTAVVVWLAVRGPTSSDETSTEPVTRPQPTRGDEGLTAPPAETVGAAQAPGVTASASASPSGSAAHPAQVTAAGRATARWPTASPPAGYGTVKTSGSATSPAKPAAPGPSSNTFHPPRL